MWSFTDGFSIVFMWEKGTEAPRSYVEEIAQLKGDELESMLPQFFFAHCENTYFSESWRERSGADRSILH